MTGGDDQPLLIDRAATARRLEEGEVREWAEGQRVFVSSVMAGYEAPRRAAVEAIEAVGAEPVIFERFGGRDSDPEEAYLAEVESSTIYVGLLGERYGRLLPTRYSATHAEYLHAEQHGLRISVWADLDATPEGRQQSFLDEVRQFHVTGSFRDEDELRQGLEARLRQIAAEDLSPWCKIGRSLFRARQISVGGGRAEIEATIRDDGVADALSSIHSGFGRSTATFAYWDGVYDAEIESVESTTRAGGSRSMAIALSVAPPPDQQTFSINGRSYDELTELAIRVSWLGEENPLGIMSFQAELPNPFEQLARLRVPEESLRPIGFILAYEILARERNVARITRFRLGPSVSGRRRFALEWLPKREYANQPDPARRQIEATVAI
jgi:hypothetical protein